MSAYSLVTIMCDAESCGEWVDEGIADTARAARRQLAGTGWTLGVSVGDGLRRDYCPKHKPPETGEGS